MQELINSTDVESALFGIVNRFEHLFPQEYVVGARRSIGTLEGVITSRIDPSDELRFEEVKDVIGDITEISENGTNFLPYLLLEGEGTSYAVTGLYMALGSRVGVNFVAGMAGTYVFPVFINENGSMPVDIKRTGEVESMAYIASQEGVSDVSFLTLPEFIVKGIGLASKELHYDSDNREHRFDNRYGPQSMTLAEELLTIDPNQPDALEVVANVYGYRREEALAYDACMRLHTQGLPFPAAAYAEATMESQEIDAHLTFVNKLLIDDPNNAGLRAIRSLMYVHNPSEDGVSTILDDTNNPDVLRELIRISVETRRPPELNAVQSLRELRYGSPPGTEPIRSIPEVMSQFYTE